MKDKITNIGNTRHTDGARNKALEKAKGGKVRPTRAGFPNGAKGGIYGGMHLEEAMRHEERRIKRNG